MVDRSIAARAPTSQSFASQCTALRSRTTCSFDIRWSVGQELLGITITAKGCHSTAGGAAMICMPCHCCIHTQHVTTSQTIEQPWTHRSIAIRCGPIRRVIGPKTAVHICATVLWAAQRANRREEHEPIRRESCTPHGHGGFWPLLGNVRT
jgi:hypothetical protein